MAIEIGKDDFLDQGSKWGGHYSITTEYAIIAADQGAYFATFAKLPEILLNQGLKALKTSNVADRALYFWVDLVRSVPFDLHVSWQIKKNLNTYKIEEYKDEEDELRLLIRQFLFEKGIVKFKPIALHVNYRNESEIVTDPAKFTAETRIMETAKYFRNDRPYYRHAQTGEGIEVFGHLEASANPIKEHNENAVRRYLERTLTGIM